MTPIFPNIYTYFSPQVNWLKNSSEYILNSTDVHVWKIKIPEHFCYLFKEHRSILDEQEYNRAKNFYWEEDFKSFLTGRMILRILLSKYLTIPASSVKFVQKTNKPTIISTTSLKYNLSYSEEYIVISIGLCETGIDIERINLNFEYENLLTSCFTKQETHYIEKIEETSRQNFFLQWTRKEALLKYTGQGIIDDLTSIPSLDGNHTNTNGKLHLKENVVVNSFILDANCMGSIAYPTNISNIKYLEW